MNPKNSQQDFFTLSLIKNQYLKKQSNKANTIYELKCFLDLLFIDIYFREL